MLINSDELLCFISICFYIIIRRNNKIKTKQLKMKIKIRKSEY